MRDDEAIRESGIEFPKVQLGVLETTGLVALVPPYFENLGKRLLKSPKLYWLDAGLACHLLGFRSRAERARSTFVGALWFRDAWLVHRPAGSAPRLRALSPGVQAVDVDSLIAELAP